MDYGWSQCSTSQDIFRWTPFNPLPRLISQNQLTKQANFLIAGLHQSDDLLIEVEDSSRGGDGTDRCDGLETTVSTGIQPGSSKGIIVLYCEYGALKPKALTAWWWWWCAKSILDMCLTYSSGSSGCFHIPVKVVKLVWVDDMGGTIRMEKNWWMVRIQGIYNS